MFFYQLRNMIVIYVPFLWVDGIALWPFVLVKHKTHIKELINHEAIHIRQQLEMGVLLFYVWYGMEFAVRYFKYKKIDTAYRNISFEREAYSNDKNLSYLKDRKFWTFLRYQ